MDTEEKIRPSASGLRIRETGGGRSINLPPNRSEASCKPPRWSALALRTVLAAATSALVTVLVACSSGDGTTASAADVPLQTGQQTALFDAMGATSLAVDAKNILYLGGGIGLLRLAPGADKPTPLGYSGSPVSSLAVTPDGTLYFVTLDQGVKSLKPGSTTPEPLPFGELRQRSQIAVGHDGTVYLGDNQRNKLLALAPGADSPTELPVDGLEGMGHMVIDGDENLFVSVMGKIVKIAKNATTAEAVDGAPDNVGGLAVDTAGNLYATDVKANTVSRMPAGGGEWVQLPFRDIQSPTRIAVDGDGTVYVVAAMKWEGLQIIKLAAK